MPTHADEQLVGAGYDAVYAGLPKSPTFARLWRQHASGDDYPAGFEHISFLTLDEMRRMAGALRLDGRSTLVDLACGMGGPGLWIARETGARIVGVDLSDVAPAAARERAQAEGLGDRATYVRGSFADTGLGAGSADAAMSVDALQYAPDKRAALAEFARILRPGGRLACAVFEVDPQVVAGLPVMGTDPVADYRPLLEDAGFTVESYDETAGWRERLTAAYQAVIDAQAPLREEMGEAAVNAQLGEMTLTLQLQPYPRRVLMVATRR